MKRLLQSLGNSLLIPFSWLYGIGVKFRHFVFETGLRKSVEFDLPVISVGNLSAGGTGKTPQVEYLIRLLGAGETLGVLSRGYGRRSRGYRLVVADEKPSLSGDEPLQLKRKFSSVMVAVCEERAIGIPIMLLDNPQLKMVILDDAFQHRQVKAGLSILLTSYAKPFSRDRLLPAGRLREPATSAARADVIIVTKCPQKPGEAEMERLAAELKRRPNQELFFSGLEYETPVHLFNKERRKDISAFRQVILLTGIASAGELKRFLDEKKMAVNHFQFSDHHHYRKSEIKKLVGEFQKSQPGYDAILTTEKDGVRLLEWENEFRSASIEIYCIPVRMKFFDGAEDRFNETVIRFVNSKQFRALTDGAHSAD
jgi:tetraacyldisaccharide 4'-kinase